MGRLRSLVTGVVFIAGDILAVSTSYLVAYAVRNYILAGSFNLLPEPMPFTPVAERAYLLAVYILVFSYEGLYTRHLAGWEATRRCLRGLAVATVAVLVILFAVRYHTMSRMIVALAFASGTVIIPTLRATLRALLVPTGLLRRPVVLVGSGETAKLFLQELKRNRNLGYVPVGQFQQPPDDRTLDEIIKREQPLAGSVPLVVFADSFGPETMKRINRYAERRFAEVLIVPDPALLQSQSVQTEQAGNLILLKYRYNLLRPANTYIKRVFELSLCILLMILFLPFFGITALLVKLSSPGPVFFRQERIGRDGRLFECLKFRTMFADAEERLRELLRAEPGIRAEWEEFARITNDPRIFPIGRFLRRFSLDELPQLWNVLRGEMALVGPRPYLPREVSQIGEYFETIVRVRPGITGLWQVSGRAMLPFRERLVLDEYYIRNWSLWMDFSILLRTIGAVLSGRGAF